MSLKTKKIQQGDGNQQNHIRKQNQDNEKIIIKIKVIEKPKTPVAAKRENPINPQIKNKLNYP